MPVEPLQLVENIRDLPDRDSLYVAGPYALRGIYRLKHLEPEELFFCAPQGLFLIRQHVSTFIVRDPADRDAFVAKGDQDGVWRGSGLEVLDLAVLSAEDAIWIGPRDLDLAGRYAFTGLRTGRPVFSYGERSVAFTADASRWEVRHR